MPVSPVRPAARAPNAPGADPSGVAPEPAEVAAHTIILRRGTYCIHVIGTSSGLTPAQLPGLSVSAAPGEESSAVEIARLSGEPWLRQIGDAILVRVQVEQVRLLLTSYNTLRTRGAAPPRVEVQRLGAGPGLAPSDAGAALEPTREITPDLLVHVRNRGDQKGQFGEWVGDRSENSWLEGFTISVPNGLEPGDLEYQAVFGKGWSSPWVKAGEYCGSRGLQLPILGLRLRLAESVAERLDVAIEAAFVDGSTFGPVGSDVVCAADPLQPITAVRLELRQLPRPEDDSAPAAKRREPAKAGPAKLGWRVGKR